MSKQPIRSCSHSRHKRSRLKNLSTYLCKSSKWISINDPKFHFTNIATKHWQVEHIHRFSVPSVVVQKNSIQRMHPTTWENHLARSLHSHELPPISSTQTATKTRRSPIFSQDIRQSSLTFTNPKHRLRLHIHTRPSIDATSRRLSNHPATLHRAADDLLSTMGHISLPVKCGRMVER